MVRDYPGGWVDIGIREPEGWEFACATEVIGMYLPVKGTRYICVGTVLLNSRVSPAIMGTSMLLRLHLHICVSFF